MEGTCTLYAIVRDGINLPEKHLRDLELIDDPHVQRTLRWQAAFLKNVIQEPFIRQVMLRSELPARDVYAMYDHKNQSRRLGYSASRILCSYVQPDNARILICGAGFLKTRDEPLQQNQLGMREAKFLADVVDEVKKPN